MLNILGGSDKDSYLKLAEAADTIGAKGEIFSDLLVPFCRSLFTPGHVSKVAGSRDTPRCSI